MRRPPSHTSRRRTWKGRSKRGPEARQGAKAVCQGSLAERGGGASSGPQHLALDGNLGVCRPVGEREGGSWLGKANKQSCCLSGVPVCRGRERWEESCDAGLGCFWSPRKQAGLKGRATNLLEDSKAEPEEGPPLSSTRGPALSPPGPRTHLGFLLPFWLLPFVLVC